MSAWTCRLIDGKAD